MSMSRWERGVFAAGRAAGRIVALAGLLAAGLAEPATASAVERGAQQRATPPKESPYARYAREHARLAQTKPARVKPISKMGRRQTVGPRGGGR